MSQRKHILTTLFFISVIFLFATYFISVNIENGYITINSSWISNNFLFACSSGIFASLLVVIAGDILELSEEQRTVESNIFFQLVNIYGQLHIAENNINKALYNKDIVASNMLNTLMETIGQASNSLRSIDYTPFFQGKNERKIKNLMADLTTVQLIDLGTLQSDCIYIAIAVNTDMVEESKKGNFSPKITSHSPNTNKTLSCLLKEIKHAITVINEDIELLDKACKGRFNWDIIRNKITTIKYPNTSLQGFWSKFNS